MDKPNNNRSISALQMALHQLNIELANHLNIGLETSRIRHAVKMNEQVLKSLQRLPMETDYFTGLVDACDALTETKQEFIEALKSAGLSELAINESIYIQHIIGERE